jgi:Tol biopolymer transport system component
MDRQGNTTSRIAEPGDYSNPALSPDEKKLAVSRMDPEKRTRDLWIFDLVHKTSSRFTFDPVDENKPIWSPDGSRIAYNVNYRQDFSDIYEKGTAGISEPRLLVRSSENKSLQDWSPDGSFITYRMENGIWALPVEGERSPKNLVGAVPHIAATAELSPDGRWIAYQTNEANRAEIYVQRLHPPTGKWQLTTNGGMEPHWRRDGKELFFISQDRLMAVPINTNNGFVTGMAKALFELRLETVARRSRYQVASNGQLFLLNRPVSSSPIVVTINWTDVRP